MSESIARRRFLTQTAGAVCGFSVINGLATPADAQVVQALMAAVSWLGRNVLAPVAVSAFTKWLNNSRLLRTPEDGSFHDHFNPGVAFDTPFQAQRTQWTGYLGVDRLPALSTAQNSPMEGELNLAEIRELQNDRNPNLWSGGQLRLAPIPNTLRLPPSRQDLAMASYDLSRFGQNPADCRVEYAREFCDCSGIPLRGFGWSSVDGGQGFRIVQV